MQMLIFNKKRIKFPYFYEVNSVKKSCAHPSTRDTRSHSRHSDKRYLKRKREFSVSQSSVRRLGHPQTPRDRVFLHSYKCVYNLKAIEL